MEQEINEMKTNVILRLSQISYIKTVAFEKKLDINDSMRDCIDLLDRLITFSEDEDLELDTFEELKADYKDTIRFINKLLN
jgi:hypothetical protein